MGRMFKNEPKTDSPKARVNQKKVLYTLGFILGGAAAPHDFFGNSVAHDQIWGKDN
jgi:hypothetical protein